MTPAQRRILIYSADVIGHPRVYCRAIADALAQSGSEIIMMLGFSNHASLESSQDLLPLLDRSEVRLIDIRRLTDGERTFLSVEELVAFQERESVDVTLFIEADKFASELARIVDGVAPPLVGRNIGIFANMAEWYPGEDSFSGEKKTILTGRPKTVVGNIYRKIFSPRGTPHWWFERAIIGRKIFDEMWTKDERLATWRGAPVYWMPEISRPFHSTDLPEHADVVATRRTQLDRFVSSNSGRIPLLYFGDAAFYKGYDMYLELLRKNDRFCAVHAGRLASQSERVKFSTDVDLVRSELLAAGRLLEIDEYVHSQMLKEMYFRVGPVYATTHRLALSSSTMIQAAELGVPVVMPDRGLVGHRVHSNRIGRTYRYGDLRDLADKIDLVVREGAEGYQDSLRSFQERFSEQSVRSFLLSRLL